MRRVILTLATVAAVAVGAGLVGTRQAEAAPYFGFSVGTPGYYGGYPGYPAYGAAPYAVAPVPQTYFYGGFAPPAVGGWGYGGYPYRYGAYYAGARPYPGHGGYHYGHHGRW